MTVWGQGLDNYRQEPKLTDDGGVVWQPAAQRSHDAKVLAPLGEAFSPNGGLKLLDGNHGRAVIQVSAVTRSEARRVRKECGRTCRSRRSPSHKKKKQQTI